MYKDTTINVTKQHLRYANAEIYFKAEKIINLAFLTFIPYICSITKTYHHEKHKKANTHFNSCHNDYTHGMQRATAFKGTYSIRTKQP